MEALTTHLNQCGALSSEKQTGALQFIAALRSCGGMILRTNYGSVEKKPQKRIDATGRTFLRLGISHPVLGNGRWHNKIPTAPKHEHGTGSVSYLDETRQLVLNQDADKKNADQWEQLASGQLGFAKMMYSRLRPRFGWIDEFGSIDSEKVASKGQIRFLFWSNVFGPDLVRKIGRDFLMNAPGWKKEELDDGGILYVVEAQYHKWHAHPSRAALQYFQAMMPKIRHYRAKPVELPGELARMVQIDDETGAETVVYERKPKNKTKRKKK
jgi:hypothetical protein